MILLLLAAAAAADTTGQEYRGTDGRTRVAIPRIEADITVDGALDEPVWQQAARLTGFSQYAPADGRPAELATEVLVWYAPGAIHFGIRAQAPPGSVRATLADRDKLGNDDRIEIYLDTWNDGRQALVFGVNPLGVQWDGALSEGSRLSTGASGGRESVDLTPDFVYTSRGRVTANGYEVEIRIPFKTLKYQALDVQDWRINVVRRITSTGHEDSWTPARRANASFLGQSGTLTGLTGLRRGLVMDVNPVATWRASGAPAEPGWSYDGQAEFGGNARWGITPNLTLSGTVNPDFSQVEADASQVITDPRQALFFSEKRPFFLEGIEQFTTPNNLVYTRRIVSPVGAAKVTGKTGNTNVALLLAFDDRSSSLDTGDPRTPFFAIARVTHDLGRQSRLGFVFTDREDGPYANRLAGVDTRLLLGRFTVTAQAAGTATRRDGETIIAPLWQMGVSRTSRRFGFNYSFQGISHDFAPAAGFISRAGVANLGFNHSLLFYGKPGATFERTTVTLQTRGVWDYEDFVNGREIRDVQVFLTGNQQIRGGWNLNATLIGERFGYDRRLYTNYAIERQLGGGVVDTIPFPTQSNIQNRDISLTLDTPRVGPASLRVNWIFGRDVNFHEWTRANVRILNATANIRPTAQLRLDASYIQQWYERYREETQVAVTHIPRLRMEYQVSRAVFVRLVGEYHAFERDSLRDAGRTDDPILIRGRDGVYRREPALARNDNNLRADLLFSFQPVPGTVFFAGYGGSYREAERFRFDGLDRTSDGFFLKASYLFRL